MVKVYGSELCPDCIACKYNFDRQNVAYEYIDINRSLADLKAFLKYRDSDPVFDPCREAGSIGIPAIVREDGKITLDWEGWMKERGLPVEEVSAGQACGIDRKGC